MKYLKKYKIFESGRWSSDVDWDYVKNNTNDGSEEYSILKTLSDRLEYIQEQLKVDEDITFNIVDILGLDFGFLLAYATVNINGKDYPISINDQDQLYIAGFPIKNAVGSSVFDDDDGFEGYDDEIVQAIIDSKPINMATKKYNI